MRVTDLKSTALDIKPDERCYGVLDIDLQTPGFKGQHRYRLTYVIRNDRPTPYVEDLTETGKYSVFGIHPPVQVFTLLEHSVAEAWEIADAAYDSSRVREKLKTLAEKSKENSIVTQYWERQAMNREWIRRNPRTADKLKESINGR